MKILKKSTTTTVLLGPFVDETDGKTAETGLTISQSDVLLWKEGGTTMAQKNDATACTSRSNGYYTCPLSTTDTDTNGILHITVHKSGALPVKETFYVVHANVFDSLISYTSLGVLANVVGWNTAAIATPDTAGYPKTTIKSGSGTGEINLSSGGVSLTTSSVNSVADQVWDEDITGHRSPNAAGAILQPLHSGTCPTIASPLTTTIKLAAGASSADDFYNGELIVAWSADGTTRVADYCLDYDGTTQTATVTGFASAPQTGWAYVVHPGGTIPGASAPSAADNAAAVWNALTASYTAAGSFGERFKVVRRAALAATNSDSLLTFDASASTTTDYYKYQTVTMIDGPCAGQTRQIVSYSSGRVATVDPPFIGTPESGNIFMILPLGIDAATLAMIADAVWDEARSGHIIAGSFGEYLLADVIKLSGDTTAADNAESFFDGTGYAGTGNTIPTVTAVTNAVSANITQISGDSAAADALEAMLDGTGGVTITAAITGAITGNITGNLSGSVGSVTGNVGGNVAGSVASVTGAVGSVTAGVTVTTNNDKTGYRLSATGVDDILDEAIAEPASVFAWASATPRNILGFLGQISRNKQTLNKDTGAFAIRNNADSANVGTATYADDATTTTKGAIS